MGMRHRELPLEGVQFHPESVLTEGGHRMLANWLAAAGHPVEPARVERARAGDEGAPEGRCCVIRLKGVGKRYGRGDFVLHDVDVSIEPGHVVGILGSNGSGKSTLLRIMAGVSHATTGSVTGTPRIGYLPDRFPAGQRMGARAYLRHMARIHGLADLSVIDPLLERLALVGGPAAPLRTLSKGNAQKVGLAQAVMVRPDLLILDEPWSGLDVGTHAILGELVAETRTRGASVVFTDHRPQVVHDHADVVHLMDSEG